jgi:hypothetical protein
VLLKVAATAAVLAACSDPPAGPDAMPCSVGDPSDAPEMQVIERTVDGEIAPLEDGGDLQLLVPPQGGHVALVGVRIKNVDLCSSTIQAALKDPVSGRVAGIERRPVAWRVAADGFAEPSQPQEISDYANVPLCPNANLAQDIDGNPWTLEVRFYDAQEDATEVVLTVTPTCEGTLDIAYCECECSIDPGACP